jgi:hypothetical protein
MEINDVSNAPYVDAAVSDSLTKFSAIQKIIFFSAIPFVFLFLACCGWMVLFGLHAEKVVVQ